MSVSNVVLEVIKHLPGIHDQQKHAGRLIRVRMTTDLQEALTDYTESSRAIYEGFDDHDLQRILSGEAPLRSLFVTGQGEPLPAEVPESIIASYLTERQWKYVPLQVHYATVSLANKIPGDQLEKVADEVRYQSEEEDAADLRSWDFTVWLVKKMPTTDMQRDRIVHLPGGEERTFKFVDRLDEFQDLNVGNFLNTTDDNVEAVFARADAEHAKYRGDPEAKFDHLNLDYETPLVKIKQLVHGQQLIDEGNLMRHCAGNYIRACSEGKSAIFTADSEVGHSTIEISRQNTSRPWQLFQHKGYNNTESPLMNWGAVRKWCKDKGIIYSDNRNS